jgi:hypothetical protein
MTRKMMTRNVWTVLLAVSLSGCLGHNALVDKALRFNLSAADGRWTREGLFVGMWIVPIYPLFTLADLFVLNSIEFWGGKNPINGRGAVVDVPKSEVQRLGLDAIEVAHIERLTETTAALYVRFENGDRVTFDVQRDGDHYSVSYAGVEFYTGKIHS